MQQVSFVRHAFTMITKFMMAMLSSPGQVASLLISGVAVTVV